LVDYCSVLEVKPFLHIDAAETSEDSEIASCIVTGSGLVDGFLKAKGLTTPTTVPQLVKFSACNFAAWAYRRIRDPASAQGFWNDAVAFLQAYIDAETEPYLGSA
jgi:phage gp36-like protein